MGFGLVAVICFGAFLLASVMNGNDDDDGGPGKLQPAYLKRR